MTDAPGVEGQPEHAHFNLAEHCLARQARQFPDRRALVLIGEGGATEIWTYGALDTAVRRLAAGLKTLGLPSQARILIRAGNDSSFVLAYLAVIAAGHVAQPTSAQLTTEEVVALSLDSEASAVVLGRDYLTERAAFPHCVVLDPDEMARLATHPPLAAYAPTAPDDPAYLVHTSGTTSRPKGVVHAQRAILGRRPMHRDWLGLGEGDVLLHAGAVNWTYTLGVGLLDPWACGATSIIYNGPRDPAVWPRLIEGWRATIFAAVPTVFRQILKNCDIAAFDLTSLRHGVAAGEALAPQLLADWHAAAGTWIYESLGMSEISTFISSRPGEPIRPGSPGRPQTGRRVAVLPIDGGIDPLPAGEIGLLAVHRSDPGLMLGYWNRPEEEAAVFRGEWFVGGDLAAFDADGWLWFHGRNDDLMNALGYRVSPMEVEKVLAHCPGVAEAAVAETRVREDVSIITAFVVPQPGAAPGEQAVLAYCGAHLATYKCPRKVVLVAQLERTPNGKVSRKATARRFAPPHA
ncbi:acyl-CoA synthetase [Xanthobacter agilis]|uniref:Acyl-coenzyme A synthetase/AMP-(Fatty) acid ligase n=1 Tax=Xanthobacter agilis TaxID=47492 RepID=A0ABU0L8I2_XANAG|nr:acyl-CoA synthetase [Xanthobacter agilis]MDQ0503370.1 acyl-coenzyme A synthetase/AMP-(fatty) acid ligase [Xanthobacter agilis]